jgi:hypothetical protein
MSEPSPPEVLAKDREDPPRLAEIVRRVVTSRDFGVRVLIGVLGTVALGWLGTKAALLGLILSLLVGEVVKEVVTARKWSLRRIWFVIVLLLLFDFGRRAWAAIRDKVSDKPGPRGSVAVPVTSTIAAAAVVVAGFSVVDIARGQSLLNHRHTTFFDGKVSPPTPTSLRLPDGRLVQTETSSAQLAFGDLRVGTRSQAKLLVLSSGSKELNELTVTTAPASFRLKSRCGPKLLARSTCGMTVFFQPARAGHFRGRLTITFRDDPKLVLALTGTGLAKPAPPTLNPDSANFGGIQLGTSSKPTPFTLTAGSEPLPLAAISSASNDYPTSNNCPSRLDPSTSCTITVTFAPTATGSRTATLTIKRSDNGTPLTAPLTGTGLAPFIVLKPNRVDFGGVCADVCGNASSTQAVVLLNTGSAPLRIKTIVSSDITNFTVASKCPTTLRPRSKCVFDVTFTPSSTGAHKATIKIVANGGGQHSLPVQGFGSIG